MARKTPSRLELRKQAEAAEEADGRKKKATKKAAKKTTRKKTTTRTRRTREKTPARKQLVWVVFSASMKEEARFPYDQRDAAEKKVDQLTAKSKKPYFIQPIKEPLPEKPAPAEE
jgi:hypothetical protein